MSQEQVPPPDKAPQQRSWQGDSPGAGFGGSSGSNGAGRRMLIVAALLLAMTGALLAMFFFVGGMQAPDVLILAVREYKSPLLPPNAFAFQDSELLEKCFAGIIKEDGAVQRHSSSQDGEEIAREFKKLRANTRRPQIVYLSALARVSVGQVYVLGGYANLDQQDSSWVPLADLLQWLSECPAPHKLLLLDLMRAGSDARFGLGAEDVAASVLTTVKSLAPEKKLSVLCACSAGQCSNVSEGLGHSLFAYYLNQGLRGFADENENQYVTAQELADYLHREVDRCAWLTRGVRQTPVLISGGHNFPLARIPERPVTTDAPKEEKYPDWLLKNWKLRNQWLAALGTLGPGLAREIDGQLLRAEQQWRSGFDETANEKSRVENELTIALSRLEPLVNAAQAGHQPPLPYSLPHDQAPLIAFTTSLQSLFLRADEPDKAKRAELDKETQKLLKDQAKTAPAELAQALLKTADELTTFGPAQMDRMSKITQLLELKERYAPMIFWERLVALEATTRKKGWNWPMPEAQQALRSMLKAEEALAEIAPDPAVLREVRHDFDEADNMRRAGENLLLSGPRLDWDAARMKLVLAQQRYESLLHRIRTVRQARSVNREALDLLPRIAPVLLSQPSPQDAETLAWKEAVQGAAKLAGLLENPDATGSRDNQLKDAYNDTRRQLDDLKKLFEARKKRCLALGAGGEGEDYQEIQALLESASMNGAEREKLWQTGQALALRLLKTVAAGPTASEQLGPDLSVAQYEHQKRLRLQKVIDLMQLAGFAAGEPARAGRDRLSDANPDAVRQIAEDLQKIWPRALLEGYKKDAPTLLYKADRLAQVLSPFDWASQKSTRPGDWSQNPTLAIYRNDLRDFWLWLDKRYRADADAVETDEPFRMAYRKLATEYERLAASLP